MAPVEPDALLISSGLGRPRRRRFRRGVRSRRCCRARPDRTGLGRRPGPRRTRWVIDFRVIPWMSTGPPPLAGKAISGAEAAPAEADPAVAHRRHVGRRRVAAEEVEAAVGGHHVEARRAGTAVGATRVGGAAGLADVVSELVRALPRTPPIWATAEATFAVGPVLASRRPRTCLSRGSPVGQAGSVYDGPR